MGLYSGECLSVGNYFGKFKATINKIIAIIANQPIVYINNLTASVF